MPREVQTLIAALEEAYKGPAWHGPNLRGSLRGLTAAQAAKRPGPDRHNIWELAIHAAYWKYAVRRRLLGDKSISFGEDGKNFFARPAAKHKGSTLGKSWRDDLAKLDGEHKMLLEVVRKLRDSELDRLVRGSSQTARFMVHGIVLHDVYHAGQIQLLKRLM
jgi:hypothetical protein